jgi:hypothetical protein
MFGENCYTATPPDPLNKNPSKEGAYGGTLSFIACQTDYENVCPESFPIPDSAFDPFIFFRYRTA